MIKTYSLALCVVLVAIAAIPAHAKPINLSCYGSSIYGDETIHYRVDLDAKTITFLGRSSYSAHIGMHYDNHEETYPITITDQYITWEYGRISNPGMSRINRLTLKLNTMIAPHKFYTEAQCQIITNKQL